MIPHRLKQFVPILEWLPGYKKIWLADDLIAGSVVLFITVPQVIAYAFLAGLPPQVGLYAAIFSLLFYGVFGSSKTLAVGPAAIIAMMTLEAVSDLAVPGTTNYAIVASKLALLTGAILLVLRVINFGAVISFLSHAVVSGFITAAATLIIFNQIPTLLGVSAAKGTDLLSVSSHLMHQLTNTNFLSLGLGLSSVVLLLLCREPLTRLLKAKGTPEVWIGALTRSAPMYAVVLSVAYVFFSGQSEVLPISIGQRSKRLCPRHC